jgi:ATP-binding cassette subfamily C protein
MESVECGAAALGMILAHFGRWVPLSELREACGVSRDGSRASNMAIAAERYGMQVKAYKMEPEALRNLPPPYVIFWNFNHYVVVDGFGDDRVYLNDPVEGPRTVSSQEFDEGFTGVVIQMTPGPKFQRGGDQPDAVRGLRERIKGSENSLMYCILAGIILVIPGLVIPLFIKIFVDNILVRELHDWLMPLLIGMGITAFSMGALRFLQLRTLRRLNFKLSTAMSGKFLWHVLALPTQFFAQRFAGEVANRTTINAALASLLSRQIALLIIDAIVVVFYGAVMFWLDWVLAAIGVIGSLVLLGVYQLTMTRSNVSLKLSMEQGKAAGTAISGLQNIETIKASGLEEDFFQRWAGFYTKALTSQQEVQLNASLVGAVPPLITTLVAMFVLIIGGQRIMDGHLTLGTLVAVQALMSQFLGPISRLVNLGNLMQKAGADLIRLDDMLLTPADPETLPKESASAETDTTTYRLKGYVTFKSVTFGFSKLEPPLIEDFNLTLKPGQRVALIGGSGSGKSTVSRLAAGLYQPWSGEVCFDGKPRSHIPREVLTNSIAFIEQDVVMFRGTVRDNLTLWDATVPDDLLAKACQDAAIHDVVQALPGGFDAQLIDGAANLSGGQRQRLEIARALAADPAVLILDEATSALDAETERHVDQHIRMRGCTCIIVAHRLSTIRDADEILILDRGKIVQRGKHADLVEVEGPYRRLVEKELGVAAV